jgi:hypothetical protein
MVRRHIILIGCIAVGVLLGCEPKVEPVYLDTRGIAPKVDYSALAVVLKKAVNKDGYVVLDKFPPVAAELEKQLKLLAVTGPAATPDLLPTKDDRLAYWYNARAAWAIQLAVMQHRDKRIDPDGLRIRPFSLDGRLMTLERIDVAIEKLGGVPAVIAAPGVYLRRAALPAEPFKPEGIGKIIRKRSVAFVDDKKRFIIDIESQKVRFPPVVWRYRKQILDYYADHYGQVKATLTTAMLPVVSESALRRLQDAVGYECVENRQPAELALEE